MSDPALPDGARENCSRCGAALPPESVTCPACGGVRPGGDGAAAHTGPLDPNRDVPLTFSAGQSLGERYTIVERVGAGGMGLIYKAIDRQLGHTVALKLIQAGVADRPGSRERFRREIALAQQVTHPNVCRVHDLGEVSGQPFISMEYVQGQNLETLVQSMGHLSPSQTVAIAKQVCAGLQAIHERGIVHRDLKPSNVMVDRLGHVVLMDFGMAYRGDQERITQAGAVFGTLAYLAPEQARGQVDPRSDLYALGLILYELLTGRRPPGDGGSLPLALRGKEEPCPAPGQFSPEVPPELDALVMRCLEREPDRRYGSARELGEHMQQFEGALTRSGLLTRSQVPAPAAGHWGARRWLALGGLLLAAVLVALLARRGAAPAGPLKPATLAVLPLAYSGPEGEAYLKDLLPLVLSQELQRTAGLVVTPFSVSRGFGPEEDARSVARQLGVGLLVRGRLAPGPGEGQSLQLELLSAEGRALWNGSLQGPTTRLLEEGPGLAPALRTALGLAPPPAGHPARPPAAVRLYLEGLSLLEGWDVPQSSARAIEAFQGATARAADFAEAYAGLARADLEEFKVSGEPRLIEQAQQAAEEALRLAPDLPEAHVALGLVQLWRGRSTEASVALERAQQLAPADDAICRAIGNAYARVGRPEAADRMFQRAVDLRPGYWYNHNAYGTHLLQTGRLANAERLFRRVIDLRPESDAGYTNLAATLITAGRAEEAEPFLLAALKIRPHGAVHNNLGFVYYSTGRYEPAAREWQAAVDSGFRGPEAYGNLGDALRQLGRAREARAAYAQAVALSTQQLSVDPADGETRALLAWCLAASGDCGRARGELLRAEQSAPQRPYVFYASAVSAALCGRRADALRYAGKAIRQGGAADIRTNPDLRKVAGEPALQALLAEAAARP